MKKYIGNSNNWMQYTKPKIKNNDVVARAIKMVCDTNTLEEFEEALRKDKQAKQFLLDSFNKAKESNDVHD